MGDKDSKHQVMGPAAKARSFKEEPLRGSINYTTWAFTFKVYLEGREAEKFIEQPDFTTTRESKQVFAELVAAVAPNVVVEIMGCKNPYGAWKALKQRFATESIAHVIAIGQRIKSKQFCGQNMSGYLEDMRPLQEDLKAAGGHMEDDEFIRTLLCGVVADHMRVIVTVFANKADVSIAELLSALLLEDERHNTLHKKSSTAEGLLFAKDRVNVQSEAN